MAGPYTRRNTGDTITEDFFNELQSGIEEHDAALDSAMMVVPHGSVAGAARPSGAAAVYWIGTVEPTNALDGDLWIGGSA